MPAFTTAALTGTAVTLMGSAAATSAAGVVTAATASGVMLAGIDAALIGGGMAAYGQYQQGQEQNAMQRSNAAALGRQAALQRAIGEREATIIGQNQVLNEYRQRKELKQGTSAMNAAYSGRGVSVATGSPLDAMADSISNAELEISIGKWNSKVEADTTRFNARTGASNLESEAALRRRYGQSAATNAMYQGVGTLLNSGTQAAFRVGNQKIGSA